MPHGDYVISIIRFSPISRGSSSSTVSLKMDICCVCLLVAFLAPSLTFIALLMLSWAQQWDIC